MKQDSRKADQQAVVEIPLQRLKGRLVGRMGHAQIEIVEASSGPKLVIRPAQPEANEE